MTLPFLIAGIVLSSNPQWFHGADTVGVLLVVVGGVGLVIQVVVVIGVLIAGWRDTE